MNNHGCIAFEGRNDGNRYTAPIFMGYGIRLFATVVRPLFKVRKSQTMRSDGDSICESCVLCLAGNTRILYIYKEQYRLNPQS